MSRQVSPADAHVTAHRAARGCSDSRHGASRSARTTTEYSAQSESMNDAFMLYDGRAERSGQPKVRRRRGAHASRCTMPARRWGFAVRRPRRPPRRSRSYISLRVGWLTHRDRLPAGQTVFHPYITRPRTTTRAHVGGSREGAADDPRPRGRLQGRRGRRPAPTWAVPGRSRGTTTRAHVGVQRLPGVGPALRSAIQRSILPSRMASGTEPSLSTSVWKARTSKLGPSSFSARVRSSRILSWPIL
jgi:hypothetical protein